MRTLMNLTASPTTKCSYNAS